MSVISEQTATKFENLLKKSHLVDLTLKTPN